MISKSLKRVLAMAMCVLCIAGSIVICSAASQKYVISELDEMSITLPDGMSAATRSTKSTDRYFSLFGLDYDTTMDNFRNSDIYLQGMNDSSTLTLTVTMTKTDESKGIKNYALLDDEELNKVKTSFLDESEYSSCTPYQSEDNKIMWFLFEANVNAGGSQIKAYQANTVYDGMSINVTLQHNGSNVTADEYSVFSGTVASVSFGKESWIQDLIPVIIIGGAVIAVILVILLILVIRHARKRGKKSRNDKIISELADKYNLYDGEKSEGRNRKKKSKKNNDTEYGYSDEIGTDGYVDISSSDSSANSEGSDYIDSEIFEDRLQAQMREDYLGESSPEDIRIYDKNKPERVVSDEEIDEILSTTRKPEPDSDSVIYSDGEQAEHEQIEEQSVAVEDAEAETDESEDAEEIYSSTENDEPDLTEDGLTETEEFNNDEELVREQAKRTKFSDSDDFFEEAPKKTMGIISNKELDEAEDYDVIKEIEQRATKVENEEEDVDAGVPIGERLMKIGRGIKSFGIHFGYFCTNVYRLIKRKRAMAKRKKAEEERRERARQRAERQRQQRRAEESGSLVKVHSRTDRRPPQSSSRNNTRSTQRKPSSTQRTRRQPSNSKR